MGPFQCNRLVGVSGLQIDAGQEEMPRYQPKRSLHRGGRYGSASHQPVDQCRSELGGFYIVDRGASLRAFPLVAGHMRSIFPQLRPLEREPPGVVSRA